MYIDSLLWYLSWPALILVSYYLVRWVVRKIEKRDVFKG